MKKILALSLLLALTKAYPNPQEVSLDDIDAKADDSARYGADVGKLDANALKEIFGIEAKPTYQVVQPAPNAGGNPEVKDDNKSSNGGIPKDIVVDDAFKQCAAYHESGYRCVPYYGCDNGQIIIDGAGLFNPRFGGINDVELNPETSKCPGNFEMCCRHPDWEGLPISNPVPIKKPPNLGPGQTTKGPNPPAVDPAKPVGPIVDPAKPGIDPVVPIEGPKAPVVEPVYPGVDPVAPIEGPKNPVIEPVAPVDPNISGPGYTDPTGIIAIPNVAPGYKPQCGARHNGGVGVRIAQTSKTAAQTQFGEWPHMCAILNMTKIGAKEHSLYVCGGSLIASNVVLTAAHCVDSITDVSKLLVRCGEWDTQQEIEPLIHQDRFALDVKIHPGFVKKNLNNDFAIIVLKEHFILNQHIDTICLPNPFFNNDLSSKSCVATGWGKDVYGKKGAYQVVMKQVEMDMVDHGTCQNKLRGTRLGQFFELDKSFNCAGGEAGKDTCTGDGGGPLVCPNAQGQYTQTGIIAWGVECGVNGVPGVYANVTEGLCFIDWATKCALGQNADLYGIQGCQRWAKRQYCEIKEELEILENLISNTNDLREKGKLFRKSRELQRVLPSYELAIGGCKNGPVDVDCLNFDYFPDTGDIDISVDARNEDPDKVDVREVAADGA